MPLLEIDGRRPTVNQSAFVAPSAWLIGDVRVGAGSSVWFNAVLRGEWSEVVIGDESNVQDCVVVHPDRHAAIVGRRVTIAHGAVLEGVVLEDEVLVGIRSAVLEGARVGRGSIIAAGSVIPAGMEIPPGSLVMGSPAKVVGRVKGNMVRALQEGWRSYVELGERYRSALRGI
ncbi:MAG: gamma carbonic anhydrase family protein [Conexivisphaera sp.]